MDIVEDNVTFGVLSNEFAIRYVEAIARSLHNSPAADFDLANMTEEADALLYELCFFGIVQIEDRSGFRRDGTSYVPRAAFETRGLDQNHLVTGTTVIHAFVDAAIDEGVDRARDAILGKLRQVS